DDISYAWREGWYFTPPLGYTECSVAAFIPPVHATATVSYLVQGASQELHIPVDQSLPRSDRWVALGQIAGLRWRNDVEVILTDAGVAGRNAHGARPEVGFSSVRFVCG